MDRPIRTGLVTALALAATACVAAPAAKAPEASPEAPASVAPSAAPDLSEVDALEHDLDRDEQSVRAELAERESQRLALSEPSANTGGEGRAPKPSAPRPEPAKSQSAAEHAPAQAGDDRAGAGAEKKKDEAQSDCELACRAVASMRRSADRICEILSDGHARCVAARRRVTDAEHRVGGAQCRCSSP